MAVQIVLATVLTSWKKHQHQLFRQRGGTCIFKMPAELSSGEYNPTFQGAKQSSNVNQ